MVESRVPVSTYRIQLNRGFGFEEALAVVPYLERLGASDLYASPVFKATEGSSHGYDVTDPLSLNPELGTEDAFERLAAELRRRGMGLLLDVVPNHMAASTENRWWMDVLENGRASPFAEFFDIDWQPGTGVPRGRVLVPILSAPVDDLVRARELRPVLEDGCLFVRWQEQRLPLDIGSYAFALTRPPIEARSRSSFGLPALTGLKRVLRGMQRLPRHEDAEPAAMRRSYHRRQRLKGDFSHAVETEPGLRSWVEETLALFSDESSGTDAAGRIKRLLEQQAYRLAFWRDGIRETNYRRFFDIGDLIGVRVGDPRVFRETHALVGRLVREGKATGLRVDHIDGLRDPLKYLRRLQSHLAADRGTAGTSRFYVLVEKILIGDETLPAEWPVSGTTGYDFFNIAAGLFVNETGFRAMRDSYARLVGTTETFDDVVYAKKKQVMRELFAGEISRLGHRLAELARRDRGARHIPGRDLTDALVEVSACLPVYRTYTRTIEVRPHDADQLNRALEAARKRAPSPNRDALTFLERVLMLDVAANAGRDERGTWLAFVMTWQQLTGAFMAKGLEDTSLYNYNPLVSLNDVGTKPVPRPRPVQAFHDGNLQRRRRWPHTMNATSTHDSKRSEDVRSRISVLSEIPDEWDRRVAKWMRWNGPKKRKVNGWPVPDAAMEVLLYQTLLGAWPLSQEEVPAFKERLRRYLLKAVRQAKTSTDWLSPDPGYEEALFEFAESLLAAAERNRFLSDFLEFQSLTARCGALNSLALVLLKATSPGTPDFYQGTELWDFSLADPDNRRPVDFALRARLLNEIVEKETEGKASLLQELLSTWEDGRVKLYVTHKALIARRENRDLFLNGDYVPLRPRGRNREHVCAFARRHGCRWSLTVVPRLLTSLVASGGLPLGVGVWGRGRLVLPETAPRRWSNVLTGETIERSPATHALTLSRVFRTLPVALLLSEDS